VYPDERRILMTPGPVVFSYDVLKSMLSTAYEHTSPDFADLFSSALKGLRRILGIPDGLPLILFPGSGTLAMEAAILNTVPRGSRVLVASNGYFGDRWALIARSLGYRVDVVSADVGARVEAEEVASAASRNSYGAVLVTHVETSTGVRMDLEGVGRALRGSGSILIVDSVSGAGAEDLRCSQWGVDVIVTASQKALEAPPGVGIIGVCSEKALEAMERASRDVGSFYMNLAEWRRVMEGYEEGSIYYYATPPTHLVAALASSTSKILAEGLEARVRRHSILARALRAGLRAIGMGVVASREEIASNTITASYTPKGVDPAELRKRVMRGNIVIANAIHPLLKGRSIRIGHMGSVNHNDIISTIAVLERSLKSLGAEVRLGAGLEAAQEILYREGF